MLVDIAGQTFGHAEVLVFSGNRFFFLWPTGVHLSHPESLCKVKIVWSRGERPRRCSFIQLRCCWKKIDRAGLLSPLEQGKLGAFVS